MKYFTIGSTGVVEIRQASTILQGAVELTEEQHTGLLNGTLVVLNGQVVPTPPPTAAKLAARVALVAQREADLAAKETVTTDAVIQYLRNHTPAECEAYVQAQVTDLASARQLLKKFAIILCVLAKESLN